MVEKLVEIAQLAGDKMMDIYLNEDFEKTVDFKADDSPLTIADKASHEIIDAALKENFPEIPVLSEEGNAIPKEERQSWDTFWCVDPLDGTKEFIKKNGEFTVNIALIKDGFPVCGVIYAPVLKTFYVGNGDAAFMIVDGVKTDISVNNRPVNRIAVRSKSHAAVEEEKVLEEYNVVDSISVGSSLKFCMVAEGKADVYYRHGPTMEWDTAAGQAVLEGAGGKVLNKEGVRFFYNKDSLLNSSFLCLGF